MDDATLSLVLERDAGDIHEPEFIAYEPLVAFEAFLADRRVYGWVRLDAARLTDLLNAHDTIRLLNVLVEDLATGRTEPSDESIVERADIVAVLASGPRGDVARRRPTRRYPVIVETGRYRMGGRVHVPLGQGLAERLDADGPMIPLTDAWLEHRVAAGDRRVSVDTILVNRDQATRIRLETDPHA